MHVLVDLPLKSPMIQERNTLERGAGYRNKRQRFDSAGGCIYLGVFHDGVVDGHEGRGDVLHHGGRDTGQEAGLHGGHHGVELPEIAHETHGREEEVHTKEEEGQDGGIRNK